MGMSSSSWSPKYLRRQGRSSSLRRARAQSASTPCTCTTPSQTNPTSRREHHPSTPVTALISRSRRPGSPMFLIVDSASSASTRSNCTYSRRAPSCWAASRTCSCVSSPDSSTASPGKEATGNTVTPRASASSRTFRASSARVSRPARSSRNRLSCMSCAVFMPTLQHPPPTKTARQHCHSRHTTRSCLLGTQWGGGGNWRGNAYRMGLPRHPRKGAVRAQADPAPLANRVPTGVPVPWPAAHRAHTHHSTPGRRAGGDRTGLSVMVAGQRGAPAW
ncbi:hypothetical protein LV78_005326 [Actinosynnema pretiosum]|nr:hypothetical protein [Actinosynnema pretiosum]